MEQHGGSSGSSPNRRARRDSLNDIFGNAEENFEATQLNEGESWASLESQGDGSQFTSQWGDHSQQINNSLDQSSLLDESGGRGRSSSSGQGVKREPPSLGGAVGSRRSSRERGEGREAQSNGGSPGRGSEGGERFGTVIEGDVDNTPLGAQEAQDELEELFGEEPAVAGETVGGFMVFFLKK